MERSGADSSHGRVRQPTETKAAHMQSLPLAALPVHALAATSNGEVGWKVELDPGPEVLTAFERSLGSDTHGSRDDAWPVGVIDVRRDGGVVAQKEGRVPGSLHGVADRALFIPDLPSPLFVRDNGGIALPSAQSRSISRCRLHDSRPSIPENDWFAMTPIATPCTNSRRPPLTPRTAALLASLPPPPPPSTQRGSLRFQHLNEAQAKQVHEVMTRSSLAGIDNLERGEWWPATPRVAMTPHTSQAFERSEGLTPRRLQTPSSHTSSDRKAMHPVSSWGARRLPQRLENEREAITPHLRSSQRQAASMSLHSAVNHGLISPRTEIAWMARLPSFPSATTRWHAQMRAMLKVEQDAHHVAERSGTGWQPTRRRLIGCYPPWC
jgi:hypothetical protein